MNEDSHEPLNKDDLPGREVDAENLVSQDSESSSQVSGTMDVQKKEEVVEKKSVKGRTEDTKDREKEMQLKKYGVLIWYGEQGDTESSCEEVYDEDDAELLDEDMTLSSAEKTDLPTEDDDDEATELSENEDKHVDQCKEESKQMKKGEDTQEFEKENIMRDEEEKIQESNEEENLQESNKEDDRQESNEEKTTTEEDENTQEAEEGNSTANGEENRQEAEGDDMQEDEEENIMADEDDRQESNEEKTTADEDEDMQEGEEGNIAANEEEDRQEAEEDDMQEDEVENTMNDEDDRQESNEEKTTADEDEQMLEGEEDDMQEDKEQNIMADEDDTQESNEERISADDDDDDMPEAEEENMADEEENLLEEQGKNVADEEKNMQVSEEENSQESEEENRQMSEEENRWESEEENIMTVEEDTQDNIMGDEEESPESKEESVMAAEEEDTQEAKKGKMMADEEDCQEGKREEITGEEESSQSEEGKEEDKGDERKTDEEEEKQKIKPIFEENEGKNIQDIGNAHASEAEALQAGNVENEQCEEEGEIPPDYICKERQSKPDNQEETTDQGATEVNSGDIQKSNNDGSVTEETNKDSAETSPVLGQKHRRRTLSFDNMEIAKTSESKSLDNSGKRTPDNSEEIQTSDECQVNRMSPIIGSRLKDTSGSPWKHDVTGQTAEGKFNLVITSVRGKVEDFTECNESSEAADDKKLASGSSDVSKDESSTSQEKNIECVEIVSESEEDNIFEECKAVVCKKCRSIWTEKVLHTIFKGSEAVTVNSKITFGAIVLINNWAHRHIQHNRETAVKNMLERADLGRNIKGLEISDLSQWLFELMDKGKIKCCAVFDAIYKPEPIKVSLSSLKKVKGASSKAIRAPCRDQNDGEMSKKRPLQLEEERLSDSQDLSKVPELTKGTRAKKKEKKDELADTSDVQDHSSPDRAQTIKEKKTMETLEQSSEPDEKVSRPSPRQSDEVPTDEDESLSKSHSSISEMQSKAVLNEDQVSAGEEVLFETEPSKAKEVSYVYEENDMEVSDHEEGGNEENVVATLRQEEEIEPDFHTTEEREILSGTVENRQSLLCKKLGLDINNINISCSSSDMKRANNGTMAKQVSAEEAVSRAHITLLKERSALHGFASEAFDLLPFEFENFYDSVHNDESTQRFMTNRELLTLHSIFILDAELPNAELFYQVLIQILMSRNQVLLVPDSRTLLQVLEKLRRDFNRAKVGKSYSEFLAQNWDMRNVYSAENLWNNKRGYPNNPNIRNVLSIFCLWKNIGKQLTDFYPSLAIQEMCKFTDLSSTDKLGMCVRLYARFCTFLYKENHPELAELFLDQKFTISNISVSRDALINSMKCQASENQRVEASLTSTETEVIQAMQNCTEAEKMALRSENPKTLRHFQRLLKQFEQKLDRYRDANTELVKRIRVAEARKEKLMNKIKDPSLRGSLHELTDELRTIYRNKRKNSSLSEAEQRSAKFARMESEPYEVAESTKEVIHNILSKGVKPELVRTVIQTVMKKVTGESALNLPDVFWIRKYAQENGFQSTES